MPKLPGTDRLSLLRKQDLQAILDGIADLHAVTTLDALVPTVWRAMKRIVPSDGASFVTASLLRPYVSIRFDDPKKEGEFRHYATAASHLFSTHPAMVIDGNDRLAERLSDLAPNGRFDDSPYCQEILKPTGTYYQLLLGVGLTDDGQAVGFSLDRASKDFSDRDKQALTLYCAHLRMAYTRLHFHARLLALIDTPVLHQVPLSMGVLLIDSDKRVLCMDYGAERILEECFTAGDWRGGSLPQPLLSWATQLVCSGVSLEPKSCPNFAKETTSGILVGTALPSQGDGRFVLVLKHARHGGVLVLDGVSELTPREWEVLEALDEGLTNQAISERIGTSIATVKAHVGNILRKLNVPNRTAAVSAFRHVPSRHMRTDVH